MNKFRFQNHFLINHPFFDSSYTNSGNSQQRKKEIAISTQGKRDSLLAEERERGTPQQERERLLQQVKTDNGEISIMERQIQEATERCIMMCVTMVDDEYSRIILV